MTLPDNGHPSARASRGAATGRAGAALDRLDRIIVAILILATGVTFSLMVLAVFAAVILREIIEIGLPWLEEVARYLLIWSVFLSAAVIARRHEHITIDVFYERLRRPLQSVVAGGIALLGMIIAGYFAYLGWQFTERAFQQVQLSPTGYLPVWVGYLVIPLGLGLCALAYLLWLVDLLRGRPVRAP